MAKERLDKLIASRSAMSRGDVKRAVREGNVSVNGSVITDCTFQADTDTDIVMLNGKQFQNSRHVYLMMNKPKGVVSASEDGRDKTVVDLVPPEYKRNGLFPAGRLDKDTTGFVLVTDDGSFAHRMLAPKSHVWKTYEATLSQPVTKDDIEGFAAGITLGDGMQCLKAVLEPLENNRVRVKICEGKYHQIKRMFAARGNAVLELKRTHIGEVALDSALPEGGCREMTEEELQKIFLKP